MTICINVRIFWFGHHLRPPTIFSHRVYSWSSLPVRFCQCVHEWAVLTPELYGCALHVESYRCASRLRTTSSSPAAILATAVPATTSKSRNLHASCTSGFDTCHPSPTVGLPCPGCQDFERSSCASISVTGVCTPFCLLAAWLQAKCLLFCTVFDAALVEILSCQVYIWVYSPSTCQYSGHA